jgi:hypothetical protein
MSDTTQSLLEGSKNVANKMADTGAQVYSETVNIASNTAKAIGSSVSNNIATVHATASQYLGNVTSVFYGIFGLVIVSFIVGYGVYVLITDNVIYQQKIVIDGTKVPIICNELSSFTMNKYLDNKNGKRRTYSFWIYLNDVSKYAGPYYRHIAHIGESAKTIIGSSPYIVLDKVANKIHVRFAPEDDVNISKTTLTGLKLNDITNLDYLIKYGTNYCGFTIEYVPVQRWVHIAFSFNDSNKGSIYIYVDGELIDIKENKFDFNFNISDLNMIHKGNLFVGGSSTNDSNGLTGFSGLLSKFTIWNIDLNQNDIYKEYTQGPFSGVLTKIGLGAYGLRSPIYKLNSGTSSSA